MIWPTVMWIDPGDMTGIAWLLAGGTSFQVDEYPFNDAAFQIEQWCAAHQGTLAIGWERYTIRRDKPQTHAYDALGIIGCARYFSAKYGCHQLPPAEQHTPKTFERKQLEAIGWWVPGKDDAQSAANHMLRYLRRSGNLPPREAAILSAAAGTI